MEDLIRLTVKPIAFFAVSFITLGVVYLGIQLSNGMRGGGEIRKAIAMIAAGITVLAFAVVYGFTNF